MICTRDLPFPGRILEGTATSFMTAIDQSLTKEPESVPAPVENELVNLRVVMVDDDQTIRHTLQQQTRAWNVRSGMATSADEALVRTIKADRELAFTQLVQTPPTSDS